MTHHPILVINSSSDAAENSMSEIIRTRSAGSLFLIEPRPRAATPDRHNLTSIRPERMDEAYCALMAAPGTSILHVPSTYRSQLLGFLEDHPQTIGDFHVVLVTVTPDDKAQSAAADTINVLQRLGANPSQLRIAFLQHDEHLPVDRAFDIVLKSVPFHAWPHVSTSARLRATAAFENAKKADVSISNILAGGDDYFRAVDTARHSNAAPEVVSQLAQKLLVQRALHGLAPDIENLLESLHLAPSVPIEESEPSRGAVALG